MVPTIPSLDRRPAFVVALLLAALHGRPAQATEQAGAAAAAGNEPSAPYSVNPGDTLIGLGRAMLVPPSAWRDVGRLNRLSDVNRLHPGQTLLIPLRLLRASDQPARIVSVQGDVRLDGQPLAASAAPARLALGQRLTTGAGSSAVVAMGDGSRIQLAPDSDLSLTESRRYAMKPAAPAARGSGTAGSTASASRPTASTTATPAPAPTALASDEGLFAGAMRLVKGSIEVLATKVLRARPLEVETPTAVIGVRGTEYRVHAGAVIGKPDTASGGATPADAGSTPAVAASTRTEVLEGRVRAETPAAESVAESAIAATEATAATAASAATGPMLGADVPSGFGAALRPGQPPLTVPLLAAPDLAAVPTLFERPLVRIALPGETQPLRLQIAADAAFDRLLRDEVVMPGGQARVAGLDDGTWQLRVRRIDGQGIEGFDARKTFTLKARPEPPAPSQPRAGAKLPVGDVTFAWAENIEAASYRMEIAHDAAFGDIVQRDDGIVGAQKSLALPAAGVYFWRLASVRTDATGGADRGPWGDAQRFELRPLPDVPTGGLSPDGQTLELRWSGRTEDRQRVELARDADFTQSVVRADLQSTQWTLPRPDTPGTYYFRYRSVEPDGFVSPWSSTLKIAVVRDWSGLWWLLAPLLFAL